MKNIVVVLLLLFFPTLIFSQTIEGKVVDEKGVALPGANILNTTLSTSSVSDLDGAFKLKANPGDNVKVSMIGFATKSIKASQGMSVVLVEESNALTEVVVIGYGTRKKVDNTTSISSLKAEDITKTKVLNATQAIQGKAAGVQIIASDLPGSTPTIVIRGLGTALSGRTPLYVVDGMPQDNINNINSNDITSYEILKDASALAIYGNRAANGVVIITTKQGKGKELKVEVESFVGFRSPQSVVKMAGSNQYAHYSNAALQSTTFSQNQPVNTDWFKEITRTGNYSQTNASFSGATETVKYFFSLGYYDEKTILKGNDYNRITFRNNNTYNISNKIKLSQTLSMGYNRITPKPLSAFTTAYKQSPIVPVYFSEGLYGVPYVAENGFASPDGTSQFNNVGNPLAQINQNDEQQRNLQIQGGLKLDIDLFKNLKYTSNYSGNFTSGKSYIFDNSLNNWLQTHPGKTASDYTGENTNTLEKIKYSNFDWNFSNYLTFSKVFNTVHDIELTAGMEASSKYNGEKTDFTLKNVDQNSNYWTLYDIDYASKVIKLVNNVTNVRTLNSYFGRFQYKLMNKYLFTGTIRRDGSSQFQDGHKWGTFPSFGVGWIVSNEKFMENSKINMLKLRGGWGKLGNQDVLLNTQNYTEGLNYYFGSNYNYGSSILSNVDPNLTWEITKETSVGLDFETFSKRLKGTFDVYNKETTNLILLNKPAITSGFSELSPAHLGAVTNKGYEITLRWDDKINDNLTYFIGGNFSTNQNRLKSITDPAFNAVTGGSLGNGQYTTRLDDSAVGEPLGSFYLYDYAGFDKTNGEMLYYKADGTTTNQAGLADADRKYVGSVMPNSTYGISLGLNFKNFDLSVDTYGTIGSKVYNGKKAQRFSGENIEESVATDFWTANNTSASNPAPFNQVPVASTYYLESGDFLRVNNISLGYKLPFKSSLISSARVYVNAINPFITKKFSGFSPELNGDGNPYGSQGVELDAYPTLKSFVFGLNLKF